MRNRNALVIGIATVVGCLPWLIITGIFFVLLIVCATGLYNKPSYGGGNKIALIHITGVVTAGEGGDGLFGSVAGSEGIVDQLERARNDDSIKAVVLRINSPGGSPSGSQEVYDEIMRLRRDGKVVVTSVGDLAASGGYFIAAASDKIYANGSSITGSIGVITETADMSKLFQKIGIDHEVLKTGKYKDMGSNLRKLTPEEKQIMNAMLDDIFRQFIRAVSLGRKMPESEVRKLATGRVFTGRQAEKLGLIDTIGGLQEAIKGAAREAGISGEPKVVEYGRGFWGGVFRESESESIKMTSREEAVIRRLLLAAPELAQ
ncbi:MAG: signal peptide peptidase SppA [Armatimonadota bacterium]|nr:signal peptide peptidase SppA [Armatimonadota bacterium]